MPTLQKITIVLTMLVVIAAYGFGDPADRQEVANKVDVADIAMGRVTLVGTLKMPIGTVVRVKCLVSLPKPSSAKSLDSATVQVIKINDKELPANDRPIFTLGQVVTFPSRLRDRIPEVREFECSAFEGINTVGIPDKAFEGRSPIASEVPWNVYPRLSLFSFEW